MLRVSCLGSYLFRNEHIQIAVDQDIRNILESAIKLVARCSFYGRCRRMNKLSHRLKLSFKIDVDHVDFAVAASNEKLAYLTASSPIYWLIGLPTNTYSVTEALLSSFHLFDVLQKCAINYEAKINGEPKIQHFNTHPLLNSPSSPQRATVTQCILGLVQLCSE